MIKNELYLVVALFNYKITFKNRPCPHAPLPCGITLIPASTDRMKEITKL